MKLLRLIPVRYLAKYLPNILAYLLTKVLGWLLVKYPHKTAKVKETTAEINAALTNLILATKDGKFDKHEINKQIELWKEVFN